MRKRYHNIQSDIVRMQTMENLLLSYIQNVIELIQPYSQRTLRRGKTLY